MYYLAHIPYDNLLFTIIYDDTINLTKYLFCMGFQGNIYAKEKPRFNIHALRKELGQIVWKILRYLPIFVSSFGFYRNDDGISVGANVQGPHYGIWPYAFVSKFP